MEKNLKKRCCKEEKSYWYWGKKNDVGSKPRCSARERTRRTDTRAHSSLRRALSTSTACSVQDKRKPNRWSFYPLGFQPLLLGSWYQAEAWWGELRMSQQKKREGKFREQSLGLPVGRGLSQSKGLARARCKTLLWRVPTREDNVGNAVTLGWDLFSLTRDPWHNYPFEDYPNTRLSGLAKGTQGSWWQGKAQTPCVTSKQVCTCVLPTGTRLMPEFNQT